MVEPISKRTVVYSLPADVSVHQEGAMDVYAPPGANEQTPVVIIVHGYRDEGFERILGCKFKDMASTVSWARLVAASGLVAVAYSNTEPEQDLRVVLARFTEQRIGLFATSGHVPLALSFVASSKCAALLYGYTFDAEEQAKQFRFVYPLAGKSIDDLATDVPLFIARAGRDEMPALNLHLDHFIAAAIARNLPITVANHPSGPHAFDLLDDSAMSRTVIRQVLTFLVASLLP